MRPSLLVLLAALLLSLPSASNAIQLSWQDGSTNLDFTETTRCMLVVKAGPGESALPPEWRLIFSADSAGVNLAMTHPGACQTDTATVSWFEAGTSADSVANQLVARFCSVAPSATTASFIFDQPGGSRGRFKVVALDPTDPDSARVLESNEVTYNGGTVGEYPPVIFRATAIHNSAMLEVAITGAGLASTSVLDLHAPDGLWTLPLSVVTKTNNRIAASAYVPTPLGAASIRLGNQEEQVGVGLFPGDGVEPDVPEATGLIYLHDPDSTNYYPKDFSLFYNQVPSGDPLNPWKGLFHVIYIREPVGSEVGTYLTHAWSDDNMQNWNWHIRAFEPSGTGWDSRSVWAPSIIQLGPRTCMFYAGEDGAFDQSIGYATTTLFYDSLSTITTPWQRQPQPAFQAWQARRWADEFGTGYFDRIQFRDPFVMRNPDNLNELLLFNVGEDVTHPGTMTVGVARNQNGSLDSWEAIGHYPAADVQHLSQPGRLESPIAMQDDTGTLPWRLIVTEGDYVVTPTGSNATYLLKQAPGYALTDTLLEAWPSAVTLYDYLGGAPYLFGWQASEHLQVGNLHLFAGFDGGRGGKIVIGQTYWSANEFVLSQPQFTGVPPKAEVGSPRFRLVECVPGSGKVRLRLEGVGVSAPRVEIFDVLGRRVAVLADGAEVRGPQEYAWGCDDQNGLPLGSGVYFARLTGVGRPLNLRGVSASLR